MKILRGEFISRVRRQLKAVKQDAFLSDRFLFSVIMKHTSWLVRREDSGNKVLFNDSTTTSLDVVDLVEVDKIEAGCKGITIPCKIMRTCHKLPELFQGYNGPLIKSVTSLDTSQEISITDPVTYLNITKQKLFRYNKTKYCWFLNDYLYFPNIMWDAVKIEGVFIGDTDGYNCEECKKCKTAQEIPFNVPDYLHAEIESQVMNDLRGMLSIPPDFVSDKQNAAR